MPRCGRTLTPNPNPHPHPNPTPNPNPTPTLTPTATPSPSLTLTKVWAHPADEMNSIWVGERVATIKFDDILSNVINRRDAAAWGPNAQFRYPMNGTGQIWNTPTPTPSPSPNP